jgi:hypothetical protein
MTIAEVEVVVVAVATDRAAGAAAAAAAAAADGKGRKSGVASLEGACRAFDGDATTRIAMAAGRRSEQIAVAGRDLAEGGLQEAPLVDFPLSERATPGRLSVAWPACKREPAACRTEIFASKQLFFFFFAG